MLTASGSGSAMGDVSLAALSVRDPAEDSSTMAREEAARKAGGREEEPLLCSICLDTTPPAELAIVESCGHSYCVKCILCWAVEKEPCRCPQCKAPFTRVACHRRLDGSLTDFPQLESLCLLKRARWFEEHLQVIGAERALAPALPETPFDPSPWQGPSTPTTPARGAGGELAFDSHGRPNYSHKYSEAFEDDDDVEAFYFSSAAGRLRVAFGNRRFGENGYIASGRKQARPAPATPAGPRGKGKGKAAASPQTPAPPGKAKGKAGNSPACPSGASSSGSSTGQATPSEEAGPGRRARRMAKRAQQDVGLACEG